MKTAAKLPGTATAAATADAKMIAVTRVTTTAKTTAAIHAMTAAIIHAATAVTTIIQTIHAASAHRRLVRLTDLTVLTDRSRDRIAQLTDIVKSQKAKELKAYAFSLFVFAYI